MTPWTTGKSRLLIEVSMRLPSPLSWNTRSTTTVAPMRKAMLMPSSVSVGMMALRATWTSSTRCSRRPLERAVAT